MIYAERDDVIVRPESDKTSGGIIIPDICQEKGKGIVVAIGPDYKLGEIEIGDTVYYRKYGAQTTEGYPVKTEDGDNLWQLKLKWIEAVIKK